MDSLAKANAAALSRARQGKNFTGSLKTTAGGGKIAGNRPSTSIQVQGKVSIPVPANPRVQQVVRNTKVTVAPGITVKKSVSVTPTRGGLNVQRAITVTGPKPTPRVHMPQQKSSAPPQPQKSKPQVSQPRRAPNQPAILPPPISHLKRTATATVLVYQAKKRTFW